MGYLFGFLAFYIYASFFSFFLGRSVGASTKRGGDELGGPLPPWELGKRCSLFFFSLSLSLSLSLFRLFFHLDFPSSSPLFRLFVPSFLEVFVMSFGTGSVVAGSSAHPHAFCFHCTCFFTSPTPAGACCFHNNRLYRQAKRIDC